MAKNWVLIVTQCNNGFCWTAYVTSKDVAYLPQNRDTFVMTADAVRAAGGGSVNKGAKRMYDLMDRLEARA